MADRVLRKSSDRVVAGVCAGIAEYLGWSPRRVRTIFVLATLLGGAALGAYVILWLVMPPPERFDLEDFRAQ